MYFLLYFCDFFFMKFSIDEVVVWNATRFIIQYIDVDKNENLQNDREFDAPPESIIGF